MFNHTGGTYPHSGMMDYPRILITQLNLGIFLTLWNSKAGSPTTEQRFVYEQPMLWIKEVEVAKSIDELMMLLSQHLCSVGFVCLRHMSCVCFSR